MCGRGPCHVWHGPHHPMPEDPGTGFWYVGDKAVAKLLRDLFFAHDAKLIDKCEQYLAMYEVKLSSLI